MKIEVSNGEILDKFSILEIKLQKIQEEEKLNNISNEKESLWSSFCFITSQKSVREKYEELKKINLELWEIEDSIRDLERSKTFDEKFIELARAVYITNDKRADIKYQINQMTGSDLVEEKSYSDYRPSYDYE
jgi:hypothetical protein